MPKVQGVGTTAKYQRSFYGENQIRHRKSSFAFCDMRVFPSFCVEVVNGVWYYAVKEGVELHGNEGTRREWNSTVMKLPRQKRYLRKGGRSFSEGLETRPIATPLGKRCADPAHSPWARVFRIATKTRHQIKFELSSFNSRIQDLVSLRLKFLHFD